MMIAIIDYGTGNLRSVANAFEAIGHRPVVTRDPADLAQATAIVLPGVGAFGDGMRNLIREGFLEPLRHEVFEHHKPFLGICLGMQFLAEQSLEHGSHQGMGWVRGTVRRIMPGEPGFKVPHMGWNDVHLERPSDLFEGLPEHPVFYFVHSYYLDVAAEDAGAVTATCWHGTCVTASLQKGHIFGVQFHPEKSQEVGLDVLRNFMKATARYPTVRASVAAAQA